MSAKKHPPSKAVYLDASAIVKLVVAEAETEALQTWLGSRPKLVTSSLSKVEVVRAVRTMGPLIRRRAEQVLSRLYLLSLDEQLLDDAADIDPVVLRSLDALHLASAQALGTALEAVVTYDQRMLEAAQALGLPTAAPT